MKIILTFDIFFKTVGLPKKMFLKLINTFFKLEILAYYDEEYLQFVVNRYKNLLHFFIPQLSTHVLWSVLYVMESFLGELIKREKKIFQYFWGGFFLFFSVQYSALLHLPPHRFHCADGCWDRTQDRCNWCSGSQTF
jgi:hypothetical protein